MFVVVHVADLEDKSASFHRCCHLEDFAELFSMERVLRMSIVEPSGPELKLRGAVVHAKLSNDRLCDVLSMLLVIIYVSS